MIIYNKPNKYNTKTKFHNIVKQTLEHKRPPLLKKHKDFLKSLKLQLKNNV